MSLRILTLPDPRLRDVCAPVGRVDDEVRTLAERMLEEMYAAPGRGLAASQVGVMKRLFVMDTTWKEGTPAPSVFVDPVVLERSEEMLRGPEGCLSIPGVTVEVQRAAAVRLGWTRLDGNPAEGWFDGFAAVCVQHEIDHLDGRLCIDLLGEAERREIETRFASAA